MKIFSSEKEVTVKMYFSKQKKYVVLDKFVYNAYLFMFVAMASFACIDFHFGFKFLDAIYFHRWFWLIITLFCSINLGLKNFKLQQRQIRSKAFLYDLMFILSELIVIYLLPPKFHWDVPHDGFNIIKILIMVLVYELFFEIIVNKFWAKPEKIPAWIRS